MKPERILPHKVETQTHNMNLSKDPVEVFCRIRPISSVNDSCLMRIDDNTLKVVPPENNVRNNRGQVYKFKHIFEENSNQQEVFDVLAKPLVEDLLMGKNGLLFAYGNSGSGKTYTMEGTSKEPGMFRRTLDVIFKSISKLQTNKSIFKSDKMNGFDILTEQEAALENQRSKFFRNNKYFLRRGNFSNGSTESLSSISDTSAVNSIDEDNGYAIFVTYVQIYNKYVYDLLDDSKEPQSKVVREDARHNMYIHDCTEVEIKSLQEAYDIIQMGQKKKKVASTNLNHESSRSHSVFTIRAVQAPLDAQGEEIVKNKNAVIISQLSLVDLAGSERTHRTKATGDRLKETGNINNSLMALRQCIEILRENQLSDMNKKVPYRDCKLTHYFKNFFEGEGKVRMVLCVNPNVVDYEETMPVLKFAEVASEVQIQRASPGRIQMPGLTPGRRKANKIFKEACNKIEAEGCDVNGLEVDIGPVFSLAGPWPATNFSEEYFESVVNNLIPFLKNKIDMRQKRKTEVTYKIGSIRSKLIAIEQENEKLKQDNYSKQAQIDNLIKDLRFYKTKLKDTEDLNQSLTKKVDQYRSFIDGQNSQRKGRHRRSKSEGPWPSEGKENEVKSQNVYRRIDTTPKRCYDDTPKQQHYGVHSVTPRPPIPCKRFKL